MPEQPSVEQGQWHKVTLRQKYASLDSPEIYICECGESKPVVLDYGEWYEAEGIHALRVYPVLDAIIADHTTAALVPGLLAWRDHITDEAVMYWCLTEENQNNPKQMLMDIIQTAIQWENDPAISESATKRAELVAGLLAALREMKRSRDAWRMTFNIYCPPGKQHEAQITYAAALDAVQAKAAQQEKQYD